MLRSTSIRAVLCMAASIAVALSVMGPALPWVAAAGEGSGPSPQAEAVVFYDGFEGTFPGAGWSAADLNSSNGNDFWANSSARAAAGAMSAWAAGDGYRPETVTLFTETFESTSLPPGWTAADDDTNYGLDYWGDSTARAHTGNSSAWSAQVGDNQESDSCPKKPCDGDTISAVLPNNTDLRRYDSYMNATLSRPVALQGYEYATVEYWYWLSSELNKDYFYVIYWAQGQWNMLNAQSGGSGAWTFASVTVPRAATQVGFMFTSDPNNVGEGAYVDDVTVTATRYINNTDSARYDDGMDAVLTRAVSLAGFDTARVEANYWLQSEPGHDRLEVEYLQGTWKAAGSFDGDTSGWQQFSLPVPVNATQLRFRFVSDDSGRMEGAYIDEVTIVGTVATLDCSATASATEGVEGQTQFVYRVDVMGGLLPVTWAWDRADGTTSNQSVQFVTYAAAGNYTASVTVRDAIGQSCTASAPTAHVAHDLSSMEVSPGYAAVTEGRSATFVAFDALGHGLELSWSVEPAQCGHVSSEGENGVFQAAQDAGGTTCSVVADAGAHQAAATVDVSHDLEEPSILPGSVEVVEGQSAQFHLTDSYGHPAGGHWSTTCGRLDTDSGPSVTFTALTTGGNACTVAAEVGTATVSATATVVHDTSELTVTPSERTLKEGGSLDLKIEDSFGHAVDARWSVEPGTCGVFSSPAGSRVTLAVSEDAGAATCAVTASFGDGAGTATVHVEHDARSGSVTPASAVVLEGESLDIAAADAVGHPLSSLWTVSPASCGVVSPAEGPSTRFTADSESGGTVCTVGAQAGSLSFHVTLAVNHGPVDTLEVTVAALSAGGTAQAHGSAGDRYGHVVDGSLIQWTTTCGGVSPATGDHTTVSAAADAGGSVCVVTAAAGAASQSAEVHVGYGGPFTVTIVPAAASLLPGQSAPLTARVTDAAGNEVEPDDVEWIAPCGTIEGTGASVTYTAAQAPGGPDCTVQALATVGGVTATGTAALSGAAEADYGLVAGAAAGAAAAGVGGFLLLRRRRGP